MNIEDNPYKNIELHNPEFITMRNRQNFLASAGKTMSDNNINHFNTPLSLEFSSESNHLSIKSFNKKIIQNHEKIKLEVNMLLEDYDGIPVIELDWIQRKSFEGQYGWCSIWIKYFDCYTDIGKRLPTLYEITREFENSITLMKLSVFNPGTELKTHKGPYMGVLRYHYPLEVPEGDCFFRLNEVQFKWKEGQGINFDDTLPHSAWNKTNERRIVIFGDFYRDLPEELDTINRNNIKEISTSDMMMAIKEYIKNDV